MSLSEVTIRPGTPEEHAERDAFVRAHKSGSFFHLAGWGSVVQRVFRLESKDLVAYRGDELVGLLPLVQVPGMFGGKNLISMPYGVYGGPLGADDKVEAALLREAMALADQMRVGHLELRYREDPGPDLPGSNLYSTFQRDLPEDPEEVLKRMPKKSRAEARKARDRYDLQLSEGSWYVDDLHRLFLNNKHSLGSPALPQRMFLELVRHFGDQCSVHLVRQGREPLAAVMCFHFGETLLAYYSGTAKDADRKASASNFMYMALQQWGVEQGFKIFDFCRSRNDSGAFRFKVHQGFEPKPLHYRFHLVRGKHLPNFNPSNSKLALLQSTWRKLPLWLVRRLSSPLSRYLP